MKNLDEAQIERVVREMTARKASQNTVGSVPTDQVEIVSLDRETQATISAVERTQLQRGSVDGKIPWSKILPKLKGERVSVYRLYTSVQRVYGAGSISRMRCYKYLNGLVTKNLATVEFDVFNGENVYIVAK